MLVFVCYTAQTTKCRSSLPFCHGRVRLALGNRFKPSSKISYWPFQGGTSFVDHLCFCVLCLSCFRVCSLLSYGHLHVLGWPLSSCLWCLLYFCYFPMWYPVSGVVLDCIVCWSLLSFLRVLPVLLIVSVDQWTNSQLTCLQVLCCHNEQKLCLKTFILYTDIMHSI